MQINSAMMILFMKKRSSVLVLCAVWAMAFISYSTFASQNAMAAKMDRVVGFDRASGDFALKNGKTIGISDLLNMKQNSPSIASDNGANSSNRDSVNGTNNLFGDGDNGHSGMGVGKPGADGGNGISGKNGENGYGSAGGQGGTSDSIVNGRNNVGNNQ